MAEVRGRAVTKTPAQSPAVAGSQTMCDSAVAGSRTMCDSAVAGSQTMCVSAVAGSQTMCDREEWATFGDVKRAKEQEAASTTGAIIN